MFDFRHYLSDVDFLESNNISVSHQHKVHCKDKKTVQGSNKKTEAVFAFVR